MAVKAVDNSPDQEELQVFVMLEVECRVGAEAVEVRKGMCIRIVRLCIFGRDVMWCDVRPALSLEARSRCAAQPEAITVDLMAWVSLLIRCRRSFHWMDSFFLSLP